MVRRLTAPRVALALTALIGCAEPPGALGPDGAPPAQVGAARAVFVVPRPGQPAPAFYDLPYPNDLRADGDGRIDLSSHPRPNPLVGGYLDAIAEGQRGFGRASAIYLRFDGPLDPRALPPSAQSTARASSPVYLVDVDPASPRRGERVPLSLHFSPDGLEVIGDNFLAAQPFAGFVLAERTTYALVATRRLVATDGSPVAAADDLRAILADEAPAEPALLAARAAYQPLIDWLDEPGADERADVVSAAVFTTQDSTSLLGRVREVIYRDVAAPRPRGLDLAAVRDGYAWYNGRYDGPRFQAGQSPYLRPDDGGAIEVDAETGDPIVQAMDTLRFSLTVPLGPRPPGGWPVVIYAHGTGGDYHSFVDDGTARRLAAVGLACISTDQVLHGPRNTGTPPEIAFFNYQNPYSARDNTLQGALDDFQLLRLVLGFDVTERHPGGRTLRFDPDRIMYFGHSQGALTGIPFVAHEPRIKAAVFSGSGGLLYQALLHKTEPLDIPGIVGLIIRDAPLDRYHPVINLLQAFMERADSISYAHLLVRAPLPGNPAKSVFLSEGLIDRYTPIQTVEALAVAVGADLVAPELRPVPGLSEAGGKRAVAPLTGNWPGATAALVQYRQVPGSDGHFVVFDVPAAERQSIEFLHSQAATGAATVVTAE